MLKKFQLWLLRKLGPQPVKPVVTDRNRATAMQLDEEDYQNWLARTQDDDNEHVMDQIKKISPWLPMQPLPMQQMEDLRYNVVSESQEPKRFV